MRRRRLALGLSLEALAEASGVSAAMLSEVARSVKNPTVKLAYQIARALGCSLTELLDEGEAKPPVVVRACERLALVDPESGVERHSLSPAGVAGLQVAVNDAAHVRERDRLAHLLEDAQETAAVRARLLPPAQQLHERVALDELHRE